jgi:hypothetical protein
MGNDRRMETIPKSGALKFAFTSNNNNNNF